MAEQGSAKRRQVRDRERSAQLKRDDVERTIGRCAQCYRLITVDSRKSRYTHVCRG